MCQVARDIAGFAIHMVAGLALMWFAATVMLRLIVWWLREPDPLAQWF